MMTHLREAFAFDVRLRQSDDRAAPGGAQVNAADVSEGVVFDSGGVRTRPRLAVYSHIIHGTATDEDLVPGTRREYSGQMEVGVDLMVITIGNSIDVRRPDNRR